MPLWLLFSSAFLHTLLLTRCYVQEVEGQGHAEQGPPPRSIWHLAVGLWLITLHNGDQMNAAFLNCLAK